MENLLGASHGLLVLAIVVTVAILVVDLCTRHPLDETQK